MAVVNPESPRLEPDGAQPVAAERDLMDTIALEAVTSNPQPRVEAGPTRLRADDAEPRDAGATAASGETDAMIGQRLGAYQIVARLGGGGMGSVYRAERVEGFEQQVAIKLIKRGMDSEAIVRRFRSEIHFQAALGKHPNIAKLLDAGTIPDGRPYFVMEYVDGQRIDEYCDRGRLHIPARLRLFDRVCDAVQFAHERAVIHRDLKPGNILVTAEGVPKLIDFGIAKLMDPESAIGAPDVLDQLTRSGELVLTPEFASPEQVQGEPATTASDVYALGVVLYQLLTGLRPYRLKTRTTSEIFQAICEQAPSDPAWQWSAAGCVRRARRPISRRRERVQWNPLPQAIRQPSRRRPHRHRQPSQLSARSRLPRRLRLIAARHGSTHHSPRRLLPIVAQLRPVCSESLPAIST